MADFLQNNPLVALGILVGNAFIISFLCYCCFRRWSNKRGRTNSTVIIPVARYVIGTPITAPAIRSPEPNANIVGNILVIRRPSLLIDEDNQPTFCVSHCQIEIPNMAKTLKEEAPPPKYDDIFPLQSASSI